MSALNYKPPPTERLYWISFGSFLTNYDVIRVERKTAEYTEINSSVQKRAQNREKTTSGDYCCSWAVFLKIEHYWGLLVLGQGQFSDENYSTFFEKVWMGNVFSPRPVFLVLLIKKKIKFLKFVGKKTIDLLDRLNGCWSDHSKILSLTW